MPLIVASKVKYEKMSDLGYEGFKHRETQVQNLQGGNEAGMLFWGIKCVQIQYGIIEGESLGVKPAETGTVTAKEMSSS